MFSQCLWRDAACSSARDGREGGRKGEDAAGGAVHGGREMMQCRGQKRGRRAQSVYLGEEVFPERVELVPQVCVHKTTNGKQIQSFRCVVAGAESLFGIRATNVLMGDHVCPGALDCAWRLGGGLP